MMAYVVDLVIGVAVAAAVAAAMVVVVVMVAMVVAVPVGREIERTSVDSALSTAMFQHKEWCCCCWRCSGCIRVALCREGKRYPRCLMMARRKKMRRYPS